MRFRMKLDSFSKGFIIAAILGFFFTFTQYDNSQRQIQLVERNIYQQGLNEDRIKTKVRTVLNPRQNGVCIQKTRNVPLNVIEANGKWVSAKTENCGLITTDPVVTSGGVITIGHSVHNINHIFIEQATIENGGLLQPGDYICIAVNKLSQLPEYETKGPWFVFPCKPAH